MATLVPKEAAPSNSTSPVEWYLMVWVMLTLASNSMAQPSGRISGASSRYRIYLCSSPFFCLADGLAILIQVVVTSIYLQISPLKASRLTIILRSDERHHTLRNKSTCFDDDFAAPAKDGPPPQSTAAWPRWLFFIVGTLPAAIQLVSFSGVAVAQTFGLMFLASFAIIELFTFLSTFKQEYNTISEILDYTKVDDVPIEEEELRFKVYRLVVRLEWVDTALLIMALIAQLLMTFVLYDQLWILSTVHTSKVFRFTFMKSMWTILASVSILLGASFLARPWFKWKSLDRWLPEARHSLFSILASVLMVLIPVAPVSASEKWISHPIVMIVGFSFRAFYWIMCRLCERCPSIAKVLLIDRRPWDLAKINHIPPSQRRRYEENTGVIHLLAWHSFCIFLSNLVLCVLWYAFVYDSAGTMNPSWTDVFG